MLLVLDELVNDLERQSYQQTALAKMMVKGETAGPFYLPELAPAIATLTILP